MVMAEDTHLAIGDVLELLKAEFPDIRISKIRFLESQGLINPERTPSGYRKFYRDDVMRLQWVLRQQRDNFLPLKVIRERLETGAVDLSDLGEPAAQPSLWEVSDADRPAPAGATVSAEQSATAPQGGGVGAVVVADTPDVEIATEPPVAEPPATESNEMRRDDLGGGEPDPTPEAPDAAGDASNGTGERLDIARLQEAPDSAGTARSGRMNGPTGVDMSGETPPRSEAVDEVDDGDVADRLQRAEVCVRAGIDDRTLAELERYGVLAADSEGTFDRRSVAIARLGGRFGEQGLEARHLRMFRMAAEREAGTYLQLVAPVMRQRNPSAREAARARLIELEQLGEELRRELVLDLIEDM